MNGTFKSLSRILVVFSLVAVIVVTLRVFDQQEDGAVQQERLYFPSGNFLVESTLGFREAMADYLWFRFVQYYGAYSEGNNDFRYFELLINGIIKLDPKFTEAYYFASLVYWSTYGETGESINMLKRGIQANPDHAKLKFQVGFIYYVMDHDYLRAAHWFEMAGQCSDATDKEPRFAAFARYRAGDDLVSLELWKSLYNSTDSSHMKELAVKMIDKLTSRIEIQKIYGDNFIGPIPEL